MLFLKNLIKESKKAIEFNPVESYRNWCKQKEMNCSKETNKLQRHLRK